MIHLPDYMLYVYASTDDILFKAMVDTYLFKKIKQGRGEEIDISSGDILKIATDGSIVIDKFNYRDCSLWSKCNWWTYGSSNTIDDNSTYIDDLKTVAAYQGYSPELNRICLLRYQKIFLSLTFSIVLSSFYY